MSVWPVNWQVRTLAAAGIADDEATFAILSTWQRSTPLPPYSNNPLGMPSGSSGAKSYLGTPYAIFSSFGMFTKAFAAFVATYQGGQLVQAMQSDNPYPAAWRIVHALGWPGTQTETDYPSALLDLTEFSYRQSVDATQAALRKTSGLVTSSMAGTTSVASSVATVNQATAATSAARSFVGDIMKGYSGNG
jgi:hypothetical protein